MKTNIPSIQNSIQRRESHKELIFPKAITILSCLLMTTHLTLAAGNITEPDNWEKKFSRIIWIAYSPPSANPHKGIEATPESIRQDLVVLREAKFTGLITYSSSGVLGCELPTLAEALGFKGLIMGIWDPTNRKEINAAKAATKIPIVLGFCVGNEGIGKRYQLPELAATIQNLHSATGKPVTTTEEIDDYSDEELLSLGDWVFPNAHPYFHSRLEPDAAVQWTKAAYQDLRRRSDRFVLFKEAGLPTTGDPGGKMSEAVQDRYYSELKKTDVQFVYFEAFDQPWKTHLPIEPHWGIFNSDRSPKRFGKRLLPLAPLRSEYFYVYVDVDSPKNHFMPTGYMGDCGDIRIDEACEESPHSGQTCIRIVYDAKGKGPHTCLYPPPAKWAGVYWQWPQDNWGTNPEWNGKGFNLSPYSRLTFWAKAEKECRIQFKVGGINEEYGDSLKYPRSKTAKLTKNWKVFEIDLKGADLKHIVGGFSWVTNWDTNHQGATFFLDDIRFEKK